jgi:hypothetical protein
MAKIPSGQHVTYQLQYRKCGKASCGTCRNGQGHGPYWYAYWREGSRLRSGYVGKNRPDNQYQSPTPPSELEVAASTPIQESLAAAIL